MIKVLVVDDSALMRKHMTQVLEGAGDFEVMTVRNGAEALDLLERFDPDVITLDVNMPEMDGITCLANIMARRPKPVVMVSSLTEEGAEVTLQAMSLGAVDFVHKPGGTISLSIDQIHYDLLTKVRAAAKARVRRSIGLRQRLETHQRGRSATSTPSHKTLAPLPRGKMGIVLIGVSTGGPSTLEEILPVLPADFPWAVLVAQHMPGSFTGVFARRLNDLCQIPVVEAFRQTPIEPGTVYIAKGDADLVVLRRGTGFCAAPVPSSKDFLWHPSVHRMVASAVDVVPIDRMIAVQLTGMGDDGAEAMAELHRRGGRTIAQDAASSIVFGMPNELIKRGGADLVMPADRIGDQLIQWLSAEPQSRKEAGHGAHKCRE
ncbi:chemotaxis-specific protein-glutamate methyltransferase CheB [Magnetospirillum molischianum]|uniref:Protein-glutamate methylesterase/protein-glutamine glutaminase n=1 Tax=Magnetospirillum molischianum DSM 120 TaxID=1150626 RepID=H8FVF7_MAGML|nr:chemotaxis-specific protein-glutamate methyltransferase CheB [Magnetospirillum molischianum]CCG42345.1 Two-component chemotaxis response transcriptional regulatory protein-glutamate methylesterase 3 [Magnetospirillum molischianum DSM 120]